MTRYLASTALSFMLLGGVAFAQTEVTGSGSVSGTGGLSVDGTSLDAAGNLGATGNAGISSGDTTVTGSTSADASASAAADADFMESLGGSAEFFFTGEGNAELRSEAEIEQALANLNDEQRAAVEANCRGVSETSGHSASVQAFCGMAANANL